MRVEDVEYFLQVVEAGAISRAASRLGMAQPSLSKAITRLERELKTPLLERHRAGVKPTAAGLAFVSHAQRLVLGAKDGVTALRELRQGSRGLVRIGMGMAVPVSVLAQTCAELLARGPVHFELRTGMADSLMQALEQGQIDLILSGIPEPANAGLTWEPLFADPLVPMLPLQHPLLATPRNLTLTALRDCRWILPSKGSVARRALEAAFVNHGLEPPDSVIDSHASGRDIELAQALCAVILLPRSLAKDPALAMRPASFRAGQQLRIERVVAALRRRAVEDPPILAQFMKVLRRVSARLPGRAAP